MKKPKVLQLNVTANWGSTGKIAEGIGQAAIKQGWESFIAYGRDMNPSESQLIKVGNQFDVYAHYARHRLFDGEGLGSKGPTKNLIKKIEQIAPDIIHLHNIHDHWLNYPILFDYFATIDTPIVWTFHDCWAFTGGCAYFEIPPCDKWRTQCGQCPLRKRKIDKSKEQYNKRRELIATLANRLTIVPVSKWLEDLCKDSMLGNSKIKLIHNGIDVSKFNVRADSTQKVPLVLGVANVWDYRKGLDDFIKLREILPKEIKFILAGLTESQIKKLPSGIKGITKTQNIDELADLYNQAIVLSSRYEGLPMVLLEAMSVGLPLISFACQCGPRDVITHDFNGLLIPEGNVQGLADAIIKIIENPSLRVRLGHNSFEKSSEYNKDIIMNRWINLFHSLAR